MKKLNCFVYLLLVLLIAACGSDPVFQQPENKHLGLDEILDHMPFDQFNEYSSAIFKDNNGNTFAFSLDIEESVIDIFDGVETYSTNLITFTYSSNFDIDTPQIEITAKIDSLPDRGFTEILLCKTTLLISSFVPGPKLTIIPGESYQHTILNEEFNWMGESFENVYSNILIEENNPDNIKIYYQSPSGIIGFTDALNRPWIFDRFE